MDEMQHHGTGNNANDFFISVSAMIAGIVAKWISVVSPTIGFLTVVVGFVAACLTAYNQWHNAKANYRKTHRNIHRH
jgi:hypothetical protein